ncbi:MAG TPA: PKD domain-containing protein [Solirubrobacteraceae bacterium]|jgi:hypothetical protein
MSSLGARPPIARAAWRIGALAAPIAVGLALLLCGGAFAAPAWLAPVTLTVPGQAAEGSEEPLVAADARGDAVAVWVSHNNLSDWFVQAATRSAGGAWEAPVTLGAHSHFGPEPQVAIDPEGNATVVWDLDAGSEEDGLKIATHPAGGTWQTPEQVSAAGEEPSNMKLAVDQLGDTAIAWSDYQGGGNIVKVSVRPAGGTWETPFTLSPAGQNYPQQIAFDGQGNAIVLWSQLIGSYEEVWSAERPAGSEWHKDAAPLSMASRNASGGQVVFDKQGDATALWHEQSGSSQVLQAATRPGGGEWQTPTVVTEGELGIVGTAFGIDRSGDVTAAWTEEVGSYKYLLQEATRPLGGSWSTPVTAATALLESTFAMTVDPQGQATVAWRQFTEGHYGVWTSRRTLGGTWQAPIEISEPRFEGGAPQIVADGQGDVVAVWIGDEGGLDEVQATAFDDAGPLLSPAIPATGTVGVPVSLSVSPLDVWSTVAATSWSFGDGQSATGATVTHTYTASGIYTIGLQSADILGNVTAITAQISIASAHAGAGPPGGNHANASTPKLGGVSETHRRWREGPGRARLARRPHTARGTHHPKRTPVGTTFSFTLNQTARVSFAFTQTLPGRSVSRKCVAETKRNRGDRHCQRTVTRGALHYDAAAGHHKLAFEGHISPKSRLPPGTYTLRITATNTANGTHSATKRLRFTIVR